MDSVQSGIAVLKMSDSEHISVDYFNLYIFEMLGYDAGDVPQWAEEAVGTPAEPLFRDALSFVHPEDKESVREAFRRHFNDERFMLDPYRMMAKDGSYRWISEKITMFGEITKTCGLKFRYKFYSSQNGAIEAVKNGRADVIGMMEDNSVIAVPEGIMLMKSYATLSLSRITKKDKTALASIATIGMM